jgi:outer membrane lipoprotein-sorting protein
MSYLLRRLPLSRLLLLCGLVVALGVCATALASALGTGPTPPAKPLAQAIHDSLAGADGEPVQGVSAHIQLTDHLLEGASLASGSDNSSAAGQLASSPLLTGASGRMWIAKDGRVRLELQAEKGDTQILYDGQTVSIYDASSNTLYRYTIPAHEGGTGSGTDSPTSPTHHEVPTVAKIEEAISHSDHVSLSEAKPDDIAGQAAYTVRVTPKEPGSLIAAGELSFDAANGAPLRAAIYSSHSPSSPTIELAATEISYAPVDSSVFVFTPPSGAKIEEIKPPEGAAKSTDPSAAQSGDHPHVTAHGQGIATVAVIESESKTKESTAKSPSAMTEGLQKIKINGIEAAELPTALGTLLSFERSGVRYALGGFVAPSAVETVAKGL